MVAGAGHDSGARRLQRLAAISAGLLMFPVAGCGSAEDRAVQSLPPGFVDELVAHVELPTDLEFAPDGRLFVTTQPGVLRVIDHGRADERPVLDISDRVCRERERGLLGITFDPQFGENRFVYVYYTFKKFGNCTSDTANVPVNRVVRYRLGRNGTIDVTTARVLIDNVPSFHAIHNGGDLAFGKDGYLYVSIGDGGRDYAQRTSKSSTNQAARDRNVLLGKIVRITRDGEPAAGNPLTGQGSVRCARSGPVNAGLTCREIYAWGLRNPFRFAFDQSAPRTRFFINDVGEATWEEVNEGGPGRDYGWNVREGQCVVLSRVRCAPGPPHMTDPLLAYGRNQGCGSITGGAFVPPGIWPREYDSAYLFADFVCGRLFVVKGTGEGGMKTFAAGLPLPSVTSMTFGPAPNGIALYYTTFARGGQVRRITSER